MADPIIYPFRVEGSTDVVSAIRGIQAATADMAKAMEGFGRASRQAGDTAKREADKTAAAAKRAADEQAKAARRAAAEAEKAAQRAGREQEKAFAREVKAAEKAAKEKAAAAAKAEEKRWREVEQTSKRIVREMEREAAAAERLAAKKATAEKKARERFLADPLRAVPSLVKYGAGAIAGLGIGAFATGATLIGGAVRESMETREIANRVSINARMAGQQGVDPRTLQKEFEAAAIATPGQNAADIGRATQAYVDLTGDLDTARSSMKTFATVASATGATVEDVATAAASLGQKFDVKKVEDMQKVFAGLVFQGKGGAMTMKDLAAQFQKLAAAGAAFNIGKGPEAVAKLGGLVQIARSGTRSPQQAGTAVENIFAGLTAHQKDLTAAGVKLFDKAGQKRDINEIVAETVAKVGGSDAGRKSAGLLKIFGRQGIRAINPLIAAEAEATKGLSGKAAQEAGFEAVMAALKKAGNAAADYGEIQKDAAQAQESAGAKLTAAWETLKAAAGDRLAPVLADIAKRFASDGKALDLLVGAVGHAADGLEALGDLLQRMGIISGGSADEKAKEAAKTEEDARKEMVALGGEHGEKYDSLSTEDKQRYRELHTKASLAATTKDRFQSEASLEGAELSEIRKSGTKDEALKLARAAYKRQGGDTFLQGFVQMFGLGSSDFAQGLAGETATQRNIRHTYEGKAAELDKGAAGTVTDPMSGAVIGKSAEALTGAAQKLTSAAEKLNAATAGSITGKPIVPGATH